MKKSFAFSALNLSVICLVASLCLSSCKKETTSTPKPPEPNEENTFTIDGKTYKATDVFYSDFDNQLKAQRITPTSGLNEVQVVTITFSDDKLPTKGGSFDIVRNSYSPGDTTNNNQVQFLASVFPYKNPSGVMDYNSHIPVFDPVQKVTVSITSNNKVNVKFSNIAVTDETGKETTVSGNITQP